MVRLLLVSAFVITMVSVAFAGESPKKLPDPLKPGPFPVGVTTTVFVDSSRTDNFTKEPRTLVTEIWYPAADSAKGKPKNKWLDFVPGGATDEIAALIKRTRNLTPADMDRLLTNDAVRDAPVRNGRWPVIVFSHGNGGTRHQNTFWCDYVASHGYIIVSADHTGNASMTIINGKLIPYQTSERQNSAKDRPKDMSFLLDKMIEWDIGAKQRSVGKGGDKRFAGKLDTDHACASGMSFGSFTAIRVADDDQRFKAIVAMSGAGEAQKNLTVPVLRMLGTEDTTLGERGNTAIREHHARHEGPSFLLELPNGGHYSFTDMFKINPNHGDGVGKGKRRATGDEFEFTSMATTYQIINATSVAFLGCYLKGQKEYLPFLRENHWGNEQVWEAKGS